MIVIYIHWFPLSLSLPLLGGGGGESSLFRDGGLDAWLSVDPRVPPGEERSESKGVINYSKYTCRRKKTHLAKLGKSFSRLKSLSSARRTSSYLHHRLINFIDIYTF
jgi:hypothetical protein